MTIPTPSHSTSNTPTVGRRVTVILNPAAGRGQGRARRPEIEKLLAGAAAASGPDAAWTILETTAPGSAATQAAKAVEDGADVIAAAGGDGTCGEVVNGIVGTGARLGIVPLGTGNDFARMLGVAGDLPKAIDVLFHGRPTPIDLGIARWQGQVAGADALTLNAQRSTLDGRWFINVAGCGFDAVVAERVNRGYRRLRGTSAYVAAVIQCLMTFRAAQMRIIVDRE